MDPVSRAAARTIPLAAAAAVLAGCSAFGFGPKDPAEALIACPKVAIVRDLAEVTQFRPGGGRDLTDVASRAALVDYTGDCEYGSDGVTVNVNLNLLAERGPALQGNQASYRYFVAVLPPGSTEPASKVEFDTAVDFPAGKTRAGSREELVQHIPLPKGANARDWQVMMGFQLSPDQLQYNRQLISQSRR